MNNPPANILKAAATSRATLPAMRPRTKFRVFLFFIYLHGHPCLKDIFALLDSPCSVSYRIRRQDQQLLGGTAMSYIDLDMGMHALKHFSRLRIGNGEQNLIRHKNEMLSSLNLQQIYRMVDAR